ncbi:BnaC03g27430D [Brassica napus]|uniref:BnaC03g27430D protein n=1 Tax=Brassica napus TaxID=3708 RepID=A0A078G7R2_BRANA|nr:BnaC03g27430D [Brassica napus]
MHTSTTSHLAVPEHPRPPICTEEAAGFHKRVKRIHDHVKFVVPCIVFEVESPIPTNRSVHLGSYIGKFDDHMYALLSLIPHFSQPFAKLQALLIAEMIDKGEESVEAFTKKMIKLQRVDIETFVGASSHPV